MSLRSWLRGPRHAHRNGGRSGRAHAAMPEPLEPRRLMTGGPAVLSVEVSSTTWSPAFTGYLQSHGLGTAGYRVPNGPDQLQVLPWSGIDRVTVRFNRDVYLQTQDLHVAGAAVAEYPVLQLRYDGATHTATWSLARPVAADKLLLHVRSRVTDADGNPLDGEWADGADAGPSGDGVAGGVFQFRVNVVAGDVNRGGAVNAADLTGVRSGAYSPFRDTNGSGTVDAADYGVVRAAQRTALPAAGILRAMPNSDEWFGAVLNAHSYIASPEFSANLPAALPLVTDVGAPDGLVWARSIAALQASHPNTLIGTYHSARDAQPTASMSPHLPRAVPREGLADNQILMKLPNYADVDVVDYTQPAARRYLVDHVVDNVARSGRPLAYLDSVSHHESGFPVQWDTTMMLVRELATNLHAMGKRAVINAAWVPGITSMQSVDQLVATGVDGVSLEMAFHPNVRGSVTRVQTAMVQYRRMLDAGLTVIFFPLPAPAGGADTMENLRAEQRLHAAYGMMFRKPGDRLFVSQLYWQPSPEWTRWPRALGAPLGGATVRSNALGQVVMTRQFAGGTLTLNAATKEVTLTAAAAASVAPVTGITPAPAPSPPPASSLLGANSDPLRL